MTVVVVTYNSADVIQGLLSSVDGGMDDVPFELVVVDNASSDSTLQYLHELRPNARVVQTGANLGYAAAFNRGVQVAEGRDAVLLLNPDVRLTPGCVEPLLRRVIEQTGVGVAVPHLVDEHGGPSHSLRREPTVLRVLGEAVLGGHRAGRWPALGELVTDPGAYTRPGPVDWASGAALLISRRCLAQVGPWEEQFFLYGEETEFCARARAAGFAVWHEPSSVMIHLGGEAPINPQLWTLLQLNRLYAYQRDRGSAGAAMRMALLLNAALRLTRPTHRAAFGALLRYRTASELPPAFWLGMSAPRTPAQGSAPSASPKLRRTSRTRRGRDEPRALIVVQNLPVPLDRRVWLESQALRDAGWDVSVISPKGPGDPTYERLDGIHLYKYRPPPQTRAKLSFAVEFAYCWLATARLTLQVLRRGRLDVLQACNPPDTYFALAAPLKLLGTRFVFDQHDLCPELYRSKFGEQGVLHRLLLLLERATYAVADHVAAPNESYRDIALQRGRKPGSAVTVVRNGPDLTRLRPVEPEPALRGGREFLCCYLGIMGPQDGVDLVLRAAHHLIRERGREDVHFALLGFGDSLDDLKELTTELDLWPWVTFTGRADDDLIRRYLSTADLGVSPDPKDPFNDVSTMNKTMEYMAFALPVVAFDLAETRVSAGDAAVYVADNDTRAYAAAIDALLDDPTRRKEMGESGRRRVTEHLVWSKQVPAYLDVYEALRRTRRRRQAR